MKYKISILTIIFLVLYNIKFIFFLLTYSFLIYEYAEVIYWSFIVFLYLILWLFVHIYVAICRSPIVNQCKETDIKLPAPTPLLNNNIKIEIYETKIPPAVPDDYDQKHLNGDFGKNNYKILDI